MKKLIPILFTLAILLSACNETKFTPNVNDELLVGTWNIDEVDNSAALVSASELMHSIIDEKFQLNSELVFSTGADFTVGNKQINGQYEIGENNKSLHLKIDGTVYSYDLVEKGSNTFQLNANSAGETTNLTISKK